VGILNKGGLGAGEQGEKGAMYNEMMEIRRRQDGGGKNKRGWMGGGGAREARNKKESPRNSLLRVRPRGTRTL